MTEDVEQAASLLADGEPDLIVFHCTAVSTLDPAMGENVCRRITTATGRPASKLPGRKREAPEGSSWAEGGFTG